jgi:DNA-binding response OmpR family regulator
MSRSVLIVEDEQELARVLKRHLKDASCTVQLAFTGDAGLRVAESKPYDPILLDIMLPGMDGLEICGRLRARRVYTPVMMLTARAHMSSIAFIAATRAARRSQATPDWVCR